MASVSIAARDRRLLFGLFLAQQEREIRRGAELPFFRDADEVYATTLIDALKFGDERGDIGTFRQRRSQRLRVQRFGGREQQRLGHAQMLDVNAGHRLLPFRPRTLAFRRQSPRASASLKRKTRFMLWLVDAVPDINLVERRKLANLDPPVPGQF